VPLPIRKKSGRRLVVFCTLTVALASSAQTRKNQLSTKEALARTVRSSVCEVLKRPQRFEGMTLTLHARYSGTWEGFYLDDASCEHRGAIYLSYPNPEPLLPKQYASLSLVRDDGLAKFEADSRALCNGMSLLCDFDSLQADFTGVIMVKHV
jgi:hypothetical protein